MPAENNNILIAEDNPGLARVLAFKFKSMGFHPISCPNGGEAWDAFQNNEIAAVVTDHEMPIMSGTDLIRKIRNAHPRLPCFMVTGRQLELSRDPSVIELQVCEIFAKPFSPATVVKAVSAAIKNAGSESKEGNGVIESPRMTAFSNSSQDVASSTVGHVPGAGV